MALMFMLVPTSALYVWMALPSRQLYGGCLCPKFGLLASAALIGVLADYAAEAEH